MEMKVPSGAGMTLWRGIQWDKYNTWCGWLCKNVENAETSADSHDTYIGADLKFPDFHKNAVYRRVKKRVCIDYCQAVDVVNWKSLLDTSKYEVDYIDGYIEEMTTKQIAKYILSQIDS